MATIQGYTDHLSVVAGDEQHFMVSVDPAAPYDASLVRLISGDVCPGGPGLRTEPVTSCLSGRYQGMARRCRPGSYGLVEGFSAIAGEATISLFFKPTLLREDQDQVLMELAGGELRIIVGALGAGLEWRAIPELKRLPVTLYAWHWLLIRISPNSVRLLLRRLAQSPLESAVDFRRQVTLASSWRLSAGVLTIAARRITTTDGLQPVQGFNGRIELPWIAAADIAENAAFHLTESSANLARHPDIMAVWDFSCEIRSSRMIDLSPHQREGRFYNTPTRAVRGIRWNGTTQDWKSAPQQYGAVHFHEDDLTDAQWPADLDWQVPEELPSGVYALRLTAGEAERMIPFFIRCAPSRPRASVALLMSTSTYLAYANNRFSMYAAMVENRLSEFASDDYLKTHPEVGWSLYERHTDGSGVHYSSYLRPIVDLAPGGRLWSFNADTNITAWLHYLGVAFDVVTDEDLHLDGERALKDYRVVITGTHPEYASTQTIAALHAHLAAAGRLIYLGGNGYYWRIAQDPENSAIIELRRAEGRGLAWDSEPGEYFHSFSGEYGGLWRLVDRAPNSLVGIGFSGLANEEATGYEKQAGADDSRGAFIFVGTCEGKRFGVYGTACGGAVSQEIDRWNPYLGSPHHALVVASSFDLPADFHLVTEDAMANYPAPAGPKLSADMTFFETPAGGAVFSTGSIGFASALAHNYYDNDICRIATNVLQRFMDAEPFRIPPE